MEMKVRTNDSSCGSGDGSRLQVLLPCQVAMLWSVMEKCGTAVATGKKWSRCQCLSDASIHDGVSAGSHSWDARWDCPHSARTCDFPEWMVTMSEGCLTMFNRGRWEHVTDKCRVHDS